MTVLVVFDIEAVPDLEAGRRLKQIAASARAKSQVRASFQDDAKWSTCPALAIGGLTARDDELRAQGLRVAGLIPGPALQDGRLAVAEPVKDEAWSLEFGSIMPAVQAPSQFEKDVVRTLSNPTGEFRNSHARTPHHLRRAGFRRWAKNLPNTNFSDLLAD